MLRNLVLLHRSLLIYLAKLFAIRTKLLTNLSVLLEIRLFGRQLLHNLPSKVMLYKVSLWSGAAFSELGVNDDILYTPEHRALSDLVTMLNCIFFTFLKPKNEQFSRFIKQSLICILFEIVFNFTDIYLGLFLHEDFISIRKYSNLCLSFHFSADNTKRAVWDFSMLSVSICTF